MDLVATGTAFAPDDSMVAPGEAPGTPIILEGGIGELPHGYLYSAVQGAARLQLTVFEGALSVQADLRELLLHELELARAKVHKGLLPQLGALDTEWGLAVVREHPNRPSLRRFIERRIQRNKPVSAASAAAIGTQLCDAVATLHPELLHGYITPDTVYLGKDGRVVLGAAGEGRLLPYAGGFSRYRAAGLLTMAAPEVLEPTPRYEVSTDVYGIAATVVEVLSGRPLPTPGARLRTLGLPAPNEMLDVLERAIAPNPADRWASVDELAAYLEQWGRRSKSITPMSVVANLPVDDDDTRDPYAPRPVAERDSLVPPPPAFSSGTFGIDTVSPPPASDDFERLAVDSAPPRPPPPPPPRADKPPRPPPPPSKGASTGRRGAPPPPPGRVPETPRPSVSANDWSALDVATRKVLDGADGPADSLTDGVGDDYRPRPPAPSPSGRDELEDLGLALDRFDDAADRLSTIDGESGLIGLTDLAGRSPPTDATRAPDRTGLSSYAARAEGEGQGYFGSLANDGDDAARPREAAASGLVVDDDPGVVANRDRKARRWVVTRQGVDQAARNLEELERLAEQGELVSTDRIRFDHQPSTLAVDLPELRAIFERKAGRAGAPTSKRGARPGDGPLELDVDPAWLPAGQRGVNAPVRAAPSSAAPRPSDGRRRSAAGTLLWILLAIAVFGGAAWILWQRSGGA